MWFAAERAVLRWSDERLDTWSFATAHPAHLFALGDRLLLHRAGEGLREFDGRDFGGLLADARPATDEIVHAAPLPDGILLAAQKSGLLRLARDGGLAPWTHEPVAACEPRRRGIARRSRGASTP